jgi:hypothetical protein
MKKNIAKLLTCVTLKFVITISRLFCDEGLGNSARQVKIEKLKCLLAYFMAIEEEGESNQYVNFLNLNVVSVLKCKRLSMAHSSITSNWKA